MGTRSLTYVEDRGKIILAIYRQYDGYPNGHGRDLFKMFEELSKTTESGRFYNGMTDYAMQLCWYLKDKQKYGRKDGLWGNTYISSLPSSNELSELSQDASASGAEFMYILRERSDKDNKVYIHLICARPSATGDCYTLYVGPLADFGKYIDAHSKN